jgi:hypothetical protein
VTYASTYPSLGFAPSLAILGPGATAGNTTATSANAVLLDSVLGASSPGGAAAASGNTKSGYLFYITGGTAVNSVVNTYASNANPITVDQTGKRFFYSDASGVIRYNAGSTAASTDSPLQ